MESVSVLEIFFWLAIFVIFYTYAGYGIVLYLMVRIKRFFNKSKELKDDFEPEVTFVVPCYNEADIVEDKVKNTLSLDYPKDKFKVVFITDGSTDGTPERLKNFDRIKVLHEDKRGGKSAAENRAMKFVDTPIVIFSDANTILPKDAIKKIVRHYADPKVGAVSGEKRVLSGESADASAAGEGIYWKYESLLKKLDSELLTIVGAAGELFSFRKELFVELEEDTILDDFMLSMRIAEKEYRVVYEPEAYAMETASASIKEELKRKIRICAGGWQSMIRLKSVLNPFKNFLLTFQYVSHRVLRWSIAPLLMFLLLPLNLFLAFEGWVYQWMLAGQIAFYTLALLGWYLEEKEIRFKMLFIPFYFFFMNASVFAGFYRYAKGKQAAAWERVKRGSLVTAKD
ncbi:MAG: glycosyltransferase family 2 protein [Cytophagaceae bacterium]